MASRPLCIINAVGLTPELLQHAAQTASIGGVSAWTSPVPAVTCTSQATMLTGLPPSKHGIVGNGWYYRDTSEIRFWQQASSLIEGKKFYEDFETAKMFWWFNQSAPVRYSATPKPHYGCDGSKVFDIIDQTSCSLVEKLGPFPFFSFWGPNAGLPCSRWIAEATALVMREKKPQITLAYLPHLDYDFQRYTDPKIERVRELDDCVATILNAAEQINAQVVVVSEYGLTPVTNPIHLNIHLRHAGLLKVRSGPFGETLAPGDSLAFAVADHQIAHLYIRSQSDIDRVRRIVESVPGVAAVVDPRDLQLDHSRSGELIVLANENSWFTYYYWLDEMHAPDFARTVDIHRKPGYDPCELFASSKTRAIARLIQKKAGFRYRMDIVPLNPRLVGGSHGLLASSKDQGPLIIGPGILPDNMLEFPAYCRGLLQS
ncbi:alkaline phosphatase family protein [Rhodopirellula sp.]|jgi:predicted AlkP superfamily pyrophosphatase or phosphodiesterase|nr:alkaline phosphatase family protein [Rhodopirellula sp.]